MSSRWTVALLVIGLYGFVGHGLAIGELEDEELWQRGQRELAAGSVAEARGHFETLLNKYPKESELYLLLGLSALKTQDSSAAESYLSHALALKPKDPDALTLMGWLQLEVKGDPAKAVEFYEKVVALKPDVAEAHNNLGVALQRMGDLERAAASFSTAVALDPNYVQALSNRGWAFVHQGDLVAAEKDFRSSLELAPDDQGALYGLARVLKSKRDYAGAQDALARLGRESPNFVYWLEWATVGAVRFYWVFLLCAIGLFFYYKYKRKMGVTSDG